MSMAQSIREMLSLAREMRRRGMETSLPQYREKFFRLAAELEDHARLRATTPAQDWPQDADYERLHRPINMAV